MAQAKIVRAILVLLLSAGTRAAPEPHREWTEEIMNEAALAPA